MSPARPCLPLRRAVIVLRRFGAMSDELQKCSARSCTRAAAIVISGKIYCVEHALQRGRDLPPPAPANRNS